MHWNWLPISLIACLCVADDANNFFITPDYINHVPRTYLLGSTLNISWHTNLTSYAIQLWQEMPNRNSAQPSAKTVYNTSTSDTKLTSLNWTVTPYELDLTLSHTFYFWLNDSISSAYFRIADPSSASSSSSAASASSSQSPTSQATNAAVTVTASPASDVSQSSSSLAIGVGVGLGVGLPLAIICGVYLGFRMRRQPSHRPEVQEHEDHCDTPLPVYVYEKSSTANPQQRPSEVHSHPTRPPPVELYSTPSELDVTNSDGRAEK